MKKFEHLFEPPRYTQQRQSSRGVPGDESNLSIPRISATGCVLRISVHDTTALQSEDIPKLNIERLPLLTSIESTEIGQMVQRGEGAYRVCVPDGSSRGQVCSG